MESNPVVGGDAIVDISVESRSNSKEKAFSLPGSSFPWEN
jgi:hypothetical protein